MKLNSTQIEEWLKNPVTGVLRSLLEEREGETAVARAQVYFPQEPNRTQEVIVELEARLHEIRVLLEVVSTAEGFTNELEATENEQVWNIPRGIQGAGEAGTH